VPAEKTAVSPGTHDCVAEVPAALAVQFTPSKLPGAVVPLDDPAVAPFVSHHKSARAAQSNRSAAPAKHTSTKMNLDNFIGSIATQRERYAT
jgi:hypothetical protein